MGGQLATRKIDRMVTFDKPGAPLTLVAWRKQAVKQATAVKIDAARLAR